MSERLRRLKAYDQPDQEAAPTTPQADPTSPFADEFTAEENLRYEGEFERGVKRGYHGLVGSMHGLRALGNEWMGDTEDRDDALQDYAERSRQASLHPKTVQKFFDTGEQGAFGSVGNLANWAAGTMGELAPSMIEAGVSAAAGGVVASQIVPGIGPDDVVAVPAGIATGLFKRKAQKSSAKLTAILADVDASDLKALGKALSAALVERRKTAKLVKKAEALIEEL